MTAARVMASQVNRALIFINQLAGKTEQPVLTAPGMHVTEKSLEFLEERDISGEAAELLGKAAEFQPESS